MNYSLMKSKLRRLIHGKIIFSVSSWGFCWEDAPAHCNARTARC